MMMSKNKKHRGVSISAPSTQMEQRKEKGANGMKQTNGINKKTVVWWE